MIVEVTPGFHPSQYHKQSILLPKSGYSPASRQVGNQKTPQLRGFQCIDGDEIL